MSVVSACKLTQASAIRAILARPAAIWPLLLIKKRNRFHDSGMLWWDAERREGCQHPAERASGRLVVELGGKVIQRPHGLFGRISGPTSRRIQSAAASQWVCRNDGSEPSAAMCRSR